MASLAIYAIENLMQSKFLNPHFTPSMISSTVIIPSHPVSRSTHLQIISYGKRNTLFPCCRQAFQIWAVTNMPQKTIEYEISDDIPLQENSNKGELVGMSSYITEFASFTFYFKLCKRNCKLVQTCNQYFSTIFCHRISEKKQTT